MHKLAKAAATVTAALKSGLVSCGLSSEQVTYFVAPPVTGNRTHEYAVHENLFKRALKPGELVLLKDAHLVQDGVPVPRDALALGLLSGFMLVTEGSALSAALTGLTSKPGPCSTGVAGIELVPAPLPVIMEGWSPSLPASWIKYALPAGEVALPTTYTEALNVVTRATAFARSLAPTVVAALGASHVKRSAMEVQMRFALAALATVAYELTGKDSDDDDEALKFAAAADFGLMYRWLLGLLVRTGLLVVNPSHSLQKYVAKLSLADDPFHVEELLPKRPVRPVGGGGGGDGGVGGGGGVAAGGGGGKAKGGGGAGGRAPIAVPPPARVEGAAAAPEAPALPALDTDVPGKAVPALTRMVKCLQLAHTGAKVKLSTLYRCLDCGEPSSRCSKLHQCGKRKGKATLPYTRADPIDLRKAYDEILAAGAKAGAPATAGATA